MYVANNSRKYRCMRLDSKCMLCVLPAGVTVGAKRYNQACGIGQCDTSLVCSQDALCSKLYLID